MKLSNYINNLKEKNGNNFGNRNCLNDEYSLKKERKEKEYMNKEFEKIKQTNELDYNKTQILNILKPTNNIRSSNEKEYDINNTKFIGVTGSKGKTTVCSLLNTYLKEKGYKTILYSSAYIDSIASNKMKDEATEVAIKSEDDIMDIIEEVNALEADYVIIEVNESTIKSGILDHFPFYIRVITNIYPYAHIDTYSEEEYVEIKKSFFKNIDDEDECICILGMSECFTVDQFNEIINLNNCEKMIFGSKYVCEKRNADYRNIDYLLYKDNNNELSNIDGLYFNVRIKNKSYPFYTNMLLAHNALNITCVISILDTLGVFNYTEFSKIIENVVIPGREEVIDVNGRKIVIGISLTQPLVGFKELQSKKQIGTIRTVCGTSGIGFKTWKKELNSERRLSLLPKNRKEAMNIASNYSDIIYLTSNDPADSDKYLLINELNNYINGKVPTVIEVDRKKAIAKAISDSKVGDLIYISGRGNRRIMCQTQDSIELFTDKEIVLDVIRKLGW